MASALISQKHSSEASIK
jgi:hypothetical protein